MAAAGPLAVADVSRSLASRGTAGAAEPLSKQGRTERLPENTAWTREMSDLLNLGIPDHGWYGG